MTANGQILLGVDGSEASLAAVAWAATEARLRGCGLLAVHACTAGSFGLWMSPAVVRRELRASAQPIVDQAVDLVREREPSVSVRGRVVVAPPATLLIRLSAGKQLTVIGASGRGALSQLMPGSVTMAVLAHATSPVVAVHPPDRTGPPTGIDRVVVAVDDPGTHARTLQFAYAEAERRKVPVLIVRALRPDCAQQSWTEPARGPWRAEGFDEVRASITETSRSLGDSVTDICLPGDLLVLGHRRHRRFAPLSLGVLATSVVLEAPCPVVVVHETQAAAPAVSRT